MLIISSIFFFFFFFFFFSSRRRHTRSLCDWSSDVCSSDLRLEEAVQHAINLPQPPLTSQTCLYPTSPNLHHPPQPPPTSFRGSPKNLASRRSRAPPGACRCRIRRPSGTRPATRTRAPR